MKKSHKIFLSASFIALAAAQLFALPFVEALTVANCVANLAWLWEL